jgi:AraC-like DNA-binding protein
MTLILNQSAWDELLQQTPKSFSDKAVLDEFEEATEVPECMGKRYRRSIELLPGVSLAQQLWNPPYRGTAKHLYLQGKVFELLAMQLDLVAEEKNSKNAQLKRSTIDRIHQARDIVLANLEHPPSVIELAQQVEVSASTLQRKFRELFGKTVFAYLTDQRMDLAEQLLRQRNCTVVEIATMVGYSNPAHFAAAFKRRFGITPSECMMGRMIVSR